MTCPGCEYPERGIVIATCRPCNLRDIARGPWYHESMRAGKITPKYAECLKALGDDIAAVHAEVKAAAKEVFMGGSA